MTTLPLVSSTTALPMDRNTIRETMTRQKLINAIQGTEYAYTPTRYRQGLKSARAGLHTETPTGPHRDMMSLEPEHIPAIEMHPQLPERHDQDIR